MLKQFIVGAAAIAAGVIPLSGVASADVGDLGDHHGDEVGLVNANNVDVLHNLNATLGVCDNNVNVLGVQVPIEDAANGVNLPVLSPGGSDAVGANPENCAASAMIDGGSIQSD